MVEQRENERVTEQAKTSENFFKSVDTNRPMTQGGSGHKREFNGDLMSDPEAGLYGEMNQLSQ